ncbi:MAG: diaminopimelate epimerase [Bacteroidota bacterium]
MMKIQFFKYQGTGNDFIIVDNRLIRWEPTVQQVSSLCDRHFGIGADGLMLLSEKPGYDFAMTYYNADGNESSMCGNGGRCMTAFARSLGLVDNRAQFWAIDGRHEAEVSERPSGSSYRLKMKDTWIERIFTDGLFLNTGSPHFVIFVDDPMNIDVFNAGRELRLDERFAPGGTNVDFVGIQGASVFVRTYERGVEDETLSCGTGVTAAAIATAFRNPGNSGLYRITTPGGELKVSFVQTGELFSEVWLEGPAKMVFEGMMEVK